MRGNPKQSLGATGRPPELQGEGVDVGSDGGDGEDCRSDDSGVGGEDLEGEDGGRVLEDLGREREGELEVPGRVFGG